MLLTSLFSGETSAQSPGNLDDFWYTPIGFKTGTGIRINEVAAMQTSAIYACIKVLSETIASLPLNIMERNANGTVSVARNHPLTEVLKLNPNPNQTSFEFFEMNVAFAALWGNTYNEIVPGRLGSVTELIPLHPSRVEPIQNADGTIKFKVIRGNGEAIFLNQEEIFRVPGLTMNGLNGIAPILFGSEAIALALAAEAFGTNFFRNDATPGMILKHPQVLSDPARQNLLSSFNRKHMGVSNSHKIQVLEEGMDIIKLTAANTDSQFLESRKFQVVEISRFYRIPLHLINDLDGATFSNIGEQSLEFAKFTILPWLCRIEKRIDKSLIVNNERFFAKFNMNALLRADIETRFKAYKIGIESGWMSRNEVREKEDMNKEPGLDDFLVMLNMGSASGAPQQACEDFREIVTSASEKVVNVFSSGLKTMIKKSQATITDDEIIYISMVDSFKTKHRSFVQNTFEPIIGTFNRINEANIDATEITDYCFENFCYDAEGAGAGLVSLSEDGTELLVNKIMELMQENA